MAHAELRHSLRAGVKGMGLRALLSLALGDLSGGALERAAAELTELRFSREAEREADSEGLERLRREAAPPRHDATPLSLDWAAVKRGT